MKRLSIIALFALTLISTTFANKPAAPYFIGIEHFYHSYPRASDVTFKVVDKYTEVSFTWHALRLNAFYDGEGNFFGASRQIAFTDLPSSGLRKIQNDYPGFEMKEAIEFAQTDADLCYYVTVAGPQKSYVLKVSQEGTIDVFKKMKN